MRTWSWVFGALFLLGLVANSYSGDKKSTDKESGTQKAKGNDAEFVQKASESDMAEIEISKLAVKQATDERVKKFATKMVEDHTKSSEQLTHIAKLRKLDLAKEITKAHRDKAEKLSKASGADFDRQFMQTQVQAHEEALKLFQDQAKNGQDPELRAFAAKTVPVIEHHLKMAQEITKGLQGGAK